MIDFCSFFSPLTGQTAGQATPWPDISIFRKISVISVRWIWGFDPLDYRFRIFNDFFDFSPKAGTEQPMRPRGHEATLQFVDTSLFLIPEEVTRDPKIFTKNSKVRMQELKAFLKHWNIIINT